MTGTRARARALSGVVTAVAAACAASSSSCAPGWAASAGPQPTVATASPTGPPTGAKTPLLTLYADAPLGSRVRSKRLRVLFVSVGDIAIYEHRTASGEPILSSVMRSYTTFKDNALADLDEFLDAVKSGYTHETDDVDEVRTLIRTTVADVTYFRVDVRYRVGAEHGAVLVYEFKEDGPDRRLASRLIADEAALAVIHYADADGFELGANETVLAGYYDATKRAEKLSFTVKKR